MMLLDWFTAFIRRIHIICGLVAKYRVEQKKTLAKFSDTCSVMADGLCIGSPRLVGGRKAGNSNMQEFFCTTLYIFSLTERN